jgi:protocatechuate 4,5-dioxygenase alpha chain
MSARQPLQSNTIPGTIVFTGELARKGFGLNQFCMSLMKPDNRARFKADERGYLKDWPLDQAQIDAVVARDYRRLLELGGNIFFVLKLAATDGKSTQSVAAALAGQSLEDYAAMMRAGGRKPIALAA